MDQIMECDSVDEQTQASQSIVMSQRHSALQSLGGSIYSANGNRLKISSATFKFKDRDGVDPSDSSSSSDDNEGGPLASRDHSV
jgi:hypothetical protein